MLWYGTTKHWMKNKIIVYILSRELSKKSNRRGVRTQARCAKCSISVSSTSSSTLPTLPLCLHLFSTQRPVPNPVQMLAVYHKHQFFVKETCNTHTPWDCSPGSEGLGTWGTWCCCSPNISSETPTSRSVAQQTMRPPWALSAWLHPTHRPPSQHTSSSWQMFLLY